MDMVVVLGFLWVKPDAIDPNFCAFWVHGIHNHLLMVSIRKRCNCELNVSTCSRLARWRAGVSQCKAAPGICAARSSDISGGMPGSSGAAITIVGMRILERWSTVSRSAIAKAQAANVSG